MLEHARKRYEFKIADSESERAQINRLLYQTFVLEIARYDDPGNGVLIDRFDKSNVYFIATHHGRVCGTMAIHDGPEFSVASAIENGSIFSRLRRPLLEARILAVESRCRLGIVFAGLACSVYRYAVTNRYASILISGLERRQAMYERMGFRPLGPAVLRGEDCFVPMSLDVADLPNQAKKDLSRWNRLL